MDQALQRLAGVAATAKDEGTDAYFRRETAINYLAAPDEPKRFALGTWLVLLIIPGINLLSIFFSPIKGGLKWLVSLVTLVFIGFIVWAVTGSFDDPFAPRDLTMTVGATTFALYIVALLYSWHADGRALESTRLPAYRKGMERRKHLLFCEPCDRIFFDDRPGVTADPADAASFLAS